MMNKLKSTAGETITEVLVASLVAVLGVLLFAMMVQSSYRIITGSENKMQEIYAAESAAEEQKSDTELTDISEGATITYAAGTDFSKIGDGKKDFGVNYYGINGNEQIISYRVN